jgi:SAM-dependent methyltransferase
MRVLDAPCGPGRIAGRLAARGCAVVGIDDSELMLDLARDAFPDVRFERVDLRELSYQAEFDAVVNWFTSFGYFDPAINDALLAAFARALRPGGRLLIEMLNADRLTSILELTGGTTAILTERGSDLMVDRGHDREPWELANRAVRRPRRSCTTGRVHVGADPAGGTEVTTARREFRIGRAVRAGGSRLSRPARA